MKSNENKQSKIIQVSEGELRKFTQKKPEIINEVVRQSLEFQTEVAQHGAEAEAIIQAGFSFTLDAVQTAMELGDTKLLQHQIGWAVDRLPNDAVQPAHILHRFEIFKKVIAEKFDADLAAKINQYFDVLIADLESWMENND